jgi:GR25 family glycosyltransferase involved in LPS biosynthesis
MSYPIFLINLSDRKDRLQESTAGAKKLGFDFQRIEATNWINLSQDLFKYAAPPVVATVHSHRSAMRAFLETSAAFGLILEDDFKPTRQFKLPRLNELENLNLDILQLGFLYSTWIESLNIFLINTRTTLLRFFLLISPLLPSGLSKPREKRMLVEISNCPIYLVPSDIRPGGHAYVISRHAAKVILSLNEPVFLSADELLKSLSVMRTLKTARYLFSQVGQSNSKSSVTQRNV